LRNLAKKGESVVIEVAQGITNASTNEISDKERREIVSLFKQILEVDDLS